MLDINALKAKKLPELQEMAKTLEVPKYRSLKKLDLVYQILDYQAANPHKVKEVLSDDKQSDSQKTNSETTKKSSDSKPKQATTKDSSTKAEQKTKPARAPRANQKTLGPSLQKGQRLVKKTKNKSL
jgi:transcription termination factor Rho